MNISTLQAVRKNKTPNNDEFYNDIKKMDFPELLRKYIAKAFKHANKIHKLKRKDIARILKEKRDKRISEHILNRWTRKDGKGLSFPIELLQDLIEITGYNKLALLIAVRFGLNVLSPEDTKVWEYYQALATANIANENLRIKEQQLLNKKI